jgi:hypothetical protein
MLAKPKLIERTSGTTYKFTHLRENSSVSMKQIYYFNGNVITAVESVRQMSEYNSEKSMSSKRYMV